MPQNSWATYFSPQYQLGATPTDTSGDDWDAMARRQKQLAFNRPTNPDEDLQIRAAEVAAQRGGGGALSRALGGQDWNTMTSLASKPRIEFDGSNLTSRQFHSITPGAGTQIMMTETSRPFDPTSIARQMAGAYGNPRQYMPQAFDQWNKGIAGLGGLQAEQRQAQQGAEDLALRRQLGLGELDIRRMSEERLGRELSMREGPVGRRESYKATLLAAGKSPAEAEVMARDAYPDQAPMTSPGMGSSQVSGTGDRRPEAEIRQGIAEAVAKRGDVLDALDKMIASRGIDYVRQNWPQIKEAYASTPGGAGTLLKALEPSRAGSLVGQTGQAIAGLNPWATSNWWTPEGRENLRKLSKTPIQESLGRAFGTQRSGTLGLLRELLNQPIR